MVRCLALFETVVPEVAIHHGVTVVSKEGRGTRLIITFQVALLYR